MKQLDLVIAIDVSNNYGNLHCIGEDQLDSNYCLPYYYP